MRAFIAWIVGIITLGVIGHGIGILGDALGVPSQVPSEAYEVYGEYRDSITTSFGLATIVFSFVVALWAGRATYFRAWFADFGPTGRLTLFAWLLATAILIITSVLTELAFRGFHGPIENWLHFGLDLSFTGGVGWACYQWWKNRTTGHRLPKK